MEETKYERLLQYLKGKPETEEYQQWAKQYHERNNHIYKQNRRVIPRSEVTWIISMFHDNSTSAHQHKDEMYRQISQ